MGNLSKAELIKLAAEDSEFYCRTFFPKTVRQPFAPFHTDAWNKMESKSRLVNLLMFRGAGKTSHCRLYTSKAIAYAMSHTILYTSKSEAHALRSTTWLRNAVENNRNWADTFGLRPGGKWTEVEFEIIAGPEEVPIWIMAAGITGSVRGVNQDDYRPDLIVLDDVLDDENAHTAEQRQKINTLVYGALLESLAPQSESPHAKMIGLNTPQNKEDFAVQALKDPSWTSAVYGCFTKETRDFPVALQESAWEVRFPTEELRAEKKAANARNMLSTFLREKECKLVSEETASFRVPWIRKYAITPDPIMTVYAIDPVPPPSEKALQKGLAKRDFEAHVVMGLNGDNRYLLDYALMRGHEPTWTVKTFFEMQRKWSPVSTLVETVAYQRVLMWLLKQAMDRSRQWYPIEEFNDKRSKFTRIVTAVNGVASARKLLIKDEHTDFLEQYSQYPQVNHDDLLDGVSMCLSKLEGMYLPASGAPRSVLEMDDRAYEPLRIRQSP